MLDLESLFRLSYGMCIVSSKKAEKFNGCIINSVFQVTPEPPTIAASVNKECLTHDYISESGVLTVSILAEDTPMAFIGRFGFRSGRDIDKLKDLNYKLGQTGAPIILDNTVAFIEAEVTESVNILTHTLFIAKIIACQTLNKKKAPMTYAYYRDVKHGRTPEKAATYHKLEPK